MKSVDEGSISGEIKTLTLQNIERQTPSSDEMIAVVCVGVRAREATLNTNQHRRK